MSTDLLLQEITDGHGLTLSQAARRLPPTRQGKPVTLSCVVRWIVDGVLGPDGLRVKLEAVRCAGRWLTSPGAMQRFVAAQTPEVATPNPAAPIRSPMKRRRASDRAARQLEKLGI